MITKCGYADKYKGVRFPKCCQTCLDKYYAQLASRSSTINENKHDYCPHCSSGFKNTKELAAHMRIAHNRLLLDKDINEQARKISLRARAAEWLDEEEAA